MKDTGGPAFPGTCDCDAHKLFVAKDGMTLRDYFAGQAMAEMIRLSMNQNGEWDPVTVAAGAYRVADAMLEARKS